MRNDIDGSFENMFDRGPVANCLQFWGARGAIDWGPVYQQQWKVRPGKNHQLLRFRVHNQGFGCIGPAPPGAEPQMPAVTRRRGCAGAADGAAPALVLGDGAAPRAAQVQSTFAGDACAPAGVW